ncbi:MAG: crossover junction endodeoxyribonuclease RuvC [Flavobacteriaceae bacterium]|jgi:crossover junction endodeoxyribonuclease RuvC
MSLQNKIPTPQIICGIDPGYDRIGVAIISGNKKKPEVVFSTCIETVKEESLPERLLFLGISLKNILLKYKPDIVAIEDLFLFKNHKTVMGVSQARGVLLYQSLLLGIPCVEYTPLQIKSAVCGYGRADKKQVQEMVTILTGKQKEKGVHDDEFDAIAIALTAQAIIK